MLQRTMSTTTSLQLGLEDLLADLRYSRRRGDLGRLALIAYCDVRRWARQAGESAIADHAAAMFTAEPHASREAFLEAVDRLVVELERAQAGFLEPCQMAITPRAERPSGVHAPQG